MPTPTKGARLGGSPSHERIILANLATQLFEHGKITTTEAKAKRLRPVAEKLITKAKRGDLHARRQVLSTVKDKGVVHVLFTEIAPSMAGRDGGYLRITKVGPRKGDNAPMALIEVVTESVEDSKKANARGAGRSVSPARKATPAAAPVAAAPAADAPAETPVEEAEVDKAEDAAAVEAEPTDLADQAAAVEADPADVSDQATEVPADEVDEAPEGPAKAE